MTTKKQCKECEREFIPHPTAPHQEFCGRKCRNLWHNNRRRYSPSNERVIVIPASMSEDNYKQIQQFVENLTN